MAILMTMNYYEKEWHSLNSNNQNKPKMARFKKIQVSNCIKIKFYWWFGPDVCL